MAKLIRCKQGHVFDAQAHKACPVCGEEVVLKATDAGPADDTPPLPPPAPRTSPLVVGGAIAVLLIAAIAGGYFAFRPHAEDVPIVKPTSASLAPAKSTPAPAPTVSSADASTTKPPPATAPATLAPTPAASATLAAAPQTPTPSQTPTPAATAPAASPWSTAAAAPETPTKGQTPAPTPSPVPQAPSPSPQLGGEATPAPLANVDPGTVGEWELSVNSSRWILRIEPNGVYAFHTEPMSAAKPDSGVFSSEAGRWTMRSNNGSTDGGPYSVVSPSAFTAKGRLGAATWRRVAGAPKSILGQVDPRTVGDWAISVGSGRWVWRIKADGGFEFHSEANDGLKPGVGTFSAMDGRWSLRSPDGYTDGGIYSFPTPDTFLATGHLGTGAWRRTP